MSRSIVGSEPAFRTKSRIDNRQIDALIGAHYYTFTAGPGPLEIIASFKADPLFGAAMNMALTIVTADAKRTGKSSYTLVSNGNVVDHKFASNLAKEGTYVVDVVPQRALVRLTGQYEIKLTGSVHGSGTPPSSVDPILTRRFQWFSDCPGTDAKSCSGIRFNADGSFTVPGGDRGVWRVFDRERNIYTLVWSDRRKSVKFMPGRGLVDVNDPSIIVFQEMP